MILKKTKVVCTIGPSSESQEILERMIEAGMNVARFNFSHGTHEEHAKKIAAVRAASKHTGKPIALMLDTKGPEMRLGLFKKGKVKLEAGKLFTLTSRQVLGDETIATVSHTGLPQEVSVGGQILLSDGLVKLKILAIQGEDIQTEIINTGMMSDRKRVAVPGVSINLPPVSEVDKGDIIFGIEQNMDYIAASFMQRGSDVVAIRKILEEHNNHMHIISKIENEAGVENIDEIINMSDGIMVARGDLGVEVPAEEVPMLQKQLIKKCNFAGKPVITATQMLESMMDNPRPTRAETGDIANAIIDGTDAIMLSGETAGGKYPVEAVETMTRIALYTEGKIWKVDMAHPPVMKGATTTEAISSATVSTADCLHAAAIISATETGKTAAMISKYRPYCPIIAVTPQEYVIRRTLLYWGVYPVLGTETTNSDEMVDRVILATLNAGYLNHGDLVVITAGVPTGKEGSTNMIRVHVVGDTLLKASGIGGYSAIGHICIGTSPAALESVFHEGDILVVHSVEKEFMPFASKAGAIIATEGGLTSPSAIVGLTLGIPTIVGAEYAMEILKNGCLVTVDSARGVVYKGIANAR